MRYIIDMPSAYTTQQTLFAANYANHIIISKSPNFTDHNYEKIKNINNRQARSCMGVFARYPRPDPAYQKVFDSEVEQAKVKIAKFPLTNGLFDNFKCYNGLPYTCVTNKILRSCMPGSNSSEDVELLEASIGHFGIPQWSIGKYNSFQRRIISNDDSKSESVFLEITTAYRLAQKIGKNNITYEPRISNGRKPDIQACVNGKKIFLELTSIDESKAERKIQAVAEYAAKYMYEKIKNKNPSRVHLGMDSTELKKNGRHIDEGKSRKYIHDWIGRLEFDKLVGAKGTIPLNNLKNYPGIRRFLQQKLSDCHLYHVENPEEYDEQKIIHNWASSKFVLDVVSSPFTFVGFESSHSSCVLVFTDSLHTTNDVLSNLEPTTAIKIANLEEQSFLDQIKRKICGKIKKRQYSEGAPIVFLIKGRLWSSLYETNPDDFSKIKSKVEEAVGMHPCISGVLLYPSNYTNGRFVHNPSAEEQIKLSKSEVRLLFSDGGNS